LGLKNAASEESRSYSRIIFGKKCFSGLASPGGFAPGVVLVVAVVEERVGGEVRLEGWLCKQ